jgi:predicted ATPase
VLLSRARLVHVGPFDDLTLSLEDDAGMPRRLVVLFGGEGVGKTSVLAAIASTRPGHAVAQLRPRGEDAAASFVVTEWMLGGDDMARGHPLRVTSPNAKLEEAEEVGLLRRREQALFDRRAAEGGFVLVSFSGARWFSRSAVVLTTPERSILRHDVRAPASFDDATRTDLTRETKQVLAYASIAAALSPGSRFEVVDRALREVLAALLDGCGVTYLGVDPARLEPIFAVGGGRRVEFDDLGRSERHLIAFGALTLRALAAAYPGAEPRDVEGVVLLDDAEAHQPSHRQRTLPARLRRALPRVQWIVTTASPAVALGCEVADVVALRREPASGRVELHEGWDAVIH